MKGKRLIAVFLSLMLMVSTMVPSASAKGFAKDSGHSGDKHSWSQSREEVADDESVSENEIVIEEPSEEESADEEEAPADESAPAEETPEEEAPVEEASEEEAPVEETPAEEPAPEEETPAEETPANEPVAYSAPSASVASYADASIPMVTAASTVTLSFNANGGSGAPSSISGTPGDTVTLPDTIPTRRNYTFLGWTTAAVSFPNTTYYAIYPAGSEYELPDSNTTLYAAWQSTNVSSSDTNAYFYIRLDGQIPYEPGSYQASAYTTGIQMTNAVTVQNWVVDVDTTKNIDGNHVSNDVTAVLSKTPSDTLIKQVVEAAGKTYDPDTQYILWYVQKYQSLGESAVNEDGKTVSASGNGWHIDGVLLDRTKVSISYDANVPAGVTTPPDVPQGYQVVSGTTVTVGESGSVGGSTARQNPSIAGYTFMGWNTKADGSGTSYSNGTQFALTENTTLYAIWSKSGNMLSLNKVDALGNALDGASFTISSGTTSIDFTAGTYTNRSILTDTVYTIEETAAPANYMGLKDAFHFIVKSDGSNLDAYLCDANGNELEEAPYGVSLSYSNSTVNITVTNVGYFYIFHTADVEEGTSVVEVPIVRDSEDGNWNPDGTYNIVNETTSGFLYGGYYSDYAGKGDYTTPTTVNGNYSLKNSATYKGDLTSWNGDNAYTVDGTAMTPVVGTTYYLKEVPTTYLLPSQIVTFQRYTRELRGIYLTTAVDDDNYKQAGFVVGASSYEGARSKTVTITPDVNTQFTEAQTVGVSDISKATSGYVVMQEYLKLTSTDDGTKYTTSVGGTDNGSKIIKCYWVTPDSIKVTGSVQRMLTVKDSNDDDMIIASAYANDEGAQIAAEVKYLDIKAAITAKAI